MNLPLNINGIKFSPQLDKADCGPACLKMISSYYGKKVDLDYLRDLCFLNRNGVSLTNLAEAAEKIGFRTLKVLISFEQLIEECPLPCILHWDQNHFVVLFKVKEKKTKFFLGKKKKGHYFKIGDPAHSLVEVDSEQLKKNWISSPDGKGIVLILTPESDFGTERDESIPSAPQKKGFLSLFKYLRPYKKYFFQIFLGMLLGSGITLLFPFLTQILVDSGINDRNYNMVHLVLGAQLFSLFGGSIVSWIRNWIMLHINTRISLTIISDFLIKMMRLPIRFFDSRTVGDLTQRIHDHHRIEDFLTKTSIESLFSILTLFVFSGLMIYYDWTLFIVFSILSFISLIWIVIFLKKRKEIDYKRFHVLRDNQDVLLELIDSMQEIKLNQSEFYKRWEWERQYIKNYKVNIQSLELDQYQRGGFNFITQLKNIILIYIAATFVMSGEMSLGMLLSISYIIGQADRPLFQLIEFFSSVQDAKISIDRLQEIHSREDEDSASDLQVNNAQAMDDIVNNNILFKNVSFQYSGPGSPFVLQNINLKIPKGKVTAIVGHSGSGKTTLLKLLLKFYKPTDGNIYVGKQKLDDLSNKLWRERCGTVMQEGYIFSDTIAKNIVPNENGISKEQLLNAARIANIDEFVDTTPLGYATKIGKSGVGLSAGQKQRILIARAVYKDPDLILFDEATSALDAYNERKIIENLDQFFIDKTVVVIAHRLSTVRHADQIIVLDRGRIVEVGNHDELIMEKGAYFELVKNQLELEKI